MEHVHSRKIILSDISDKTVYPTIIKNNGSEYLTLHYYNAVDDSVLHDAEHFICFPDYPCLEQFCRERDLFIGQGIGHYDFDSPVQNPIDYDSILNNWNLLNTISNLFHIYFEGNAKKYNALYELLFRYNMAIDPLPPTVIMREKDVQNLQRIFRKKDRALNRFAFYREQSE